MRRAVSAAAVLAALSLGVPGIAAAHGRGHHKRHHARHAVRARLERFEPNGTVTTTSGSATTTTGTPSTGTDNAGTVASFTGGVLTITLADGTTVSGKVTDATRIECGSSETETGDDDATESGDQSVHRDGDGGDGSGDEGGAAGSACTSAALTPNAVVHEAELRITSAGAVFAKVELA